MGPSVTCTSHSAAPGVGHGEGQPSSADSGMYNGFSKVKYIFISVSQDFSFFAVLKIFHINM